ncbi:MAG: transposase [Candidatus Omnitrophota bacterium]
MAEEEKEPEKRLAWDYYTRNDAFVKERFLAKDYDRATACGLGNFDRLFAFFCQMDLFSLFDFRPKARQRIMIPTVLLLSTYSAKIICEMNSLNQVDMQLFKDRALLEMIGFTGVQIEEGFSKRSKGRHLPFNISTLGKLMPDFSPAETNSLFSNQFALLAQKNFVPSGIFAADSTPLYVSFHSKYPNTGIIKKDGKRYRGYKLITLKYVGSFSQKAKPKPEIFVAAILVPLNESENKYLLPLLEQARKNIGPDKIKMVVVDRGFLSGENLWEVKHKYGTDFLIYSKSNMDVTKELNVRLKDARDRQKRGLPEDEDKNLFFQKDNQHTVYGFNNLRWFWTYGDKEHQVEMKKKLYQKEKHFQTNPISGAIITRYQDKEDKNITLLSSRRFSQSFTPLDAITFYHKRQQIENAGFRELKQGYNIGNFPSRKYNGVFFHVLFTLLIFNFVTAFKTETGGKTATLGLRRLHRTTSFVGLILHAWPHFGLFHPNEVFGWIGYAGKGYRAPP